MGAFVHQTAEVEPGAVLGEGTRVWQQGHVRCGAVIGAECTLGRNVLVDEGVLVGDRVQIQDNVSVYRGVELGDDVLVGPSAVFTNVPAPRAHGTQTQVGCTLVRAGASIGANATVVGGVVIGRNALVGAGSVVTRDVADHQLVYGNPALPHGWVCRCGAVVSRAPQAPERLSCATCLEERARPPEHTEPAEFAGLAGLAGLAGFTVFTEFAVPAPQSGPMESVPR